MLFHPGAQVVEELALVALLETGQLQVVAPQVGVGAMGGATAQHGAGDQSVVARLQLAGGQFVEVGAQAGAHQTRLFHHRTGQGDHPLGPQLPGREQLADGNHVLVVQVPHALAGTHRVEEVDMGAGQARRMRTGECLRGHAGERLAG
ncbi:Uncharacterised protein [Acinetobacter baumannii]|nr:Uncharacterised protein [Acinetobacter baumannii]